MKKTLFFCILVLVISACSESNKVEISEAEKSEFESLKLQGHSKDWWHNTIFYQIWPRSFYDADGDGSGDFKGMTAKLDYLVDLGVNGIWLTPVFEAPSYHGYDFQDFYAVESDYGTMEDFEEFIAEAHKRDIKIVLDLVLNHISSDHEWFKRSAANDPEYSDYFIWRDELPKGWGRAWSSEEDPAAVWHWNETRQAYYYGAFSPNQPDVNLENPAVVNALNEVARFWLEKGVDGFRLDAVRYAIEEGGYPLQADTDSTIQYWSDFTRFVKSVKPDAMLVGEAWTGLDTVGKYHNRGQGLDSAFDFDFGYVVIGLLKPEASQTADFGTVGTRDLKNNRDDLWNNLLGRKAAAPMMFFSPHLTNHDQVRIMHALDNDANKARVAASLLLTTPGSLYIYYGEEIGLSQFTTGDDQYKRALMYWDEGPSAGFNSSGAVWLDQKKWFPWAENHTPWWTPYWDTLRSKGHSVASQTGDKKSLLNHYKGLIAIRNELQTLQFPDEIRYYPIDNDSIWLLEYRSGDLSTWVIHNLDPHKAVQFAAPEALRGKHRDRLTGVELDITATLALEAAQSMIF